MGYLFAIVLIFIPVFFIAQYIRELTKDRALLLNAELSDMQVEVLSTHSPYYTALRPEHKKLFEKRVATFLVRKRFIGLEGLETFVAMETLIAAEAIKITFGLKKYLLPHFKTIMIYPGAYYSRQTGKYHKGEIDMRGIIKLSWDGFGEGISDHADGINLAVHEFAHALYFENFIKNRHYLFLDKRAMKEWDRLAKEEVDILKEADEHFIRAYGGTNKEEFFAVSTEHFFEQPTQFSQEHPDLYDLMVKIYRQDPAAILKTHS